MSIFDDESLKCECVGKEHFDDLCISCQNAVKNYASDGSPVSDFWPFDEEMSGCDCDGCNEYHHQYHKWENF